MANRLRYDSESIAPFAYCKAVMRQLPYITSDLEGVGGVIKADPTHFEVEELLPYAPCGEGEHVFVTLRRKGWNTLDVATALADCFSLKPMDVGWGGRKDKQAVATQTFSVLLPESMPIKEIETRLAELDFEILSTVRHRNKLKIGHVAGNRFRLLLSGVAAGAMDRALPIAAEVRRRGLPNFYGEQRFGIRMENLDRAENLLLSRKPARGRKGAFWVSVLQSAMFNVWLADRMGRGQFGTVIDGDVAQKTDTGGLFVVDDVCEAAERFGRNAVVYTGPIFGYKMMAAAGQAARYEADILASFDVDDEALKRLRAKGARRRGLLWVDDLCIAPDAQGLRFSFSLPPGSYATVVMREFTRPPDIS